MLPISLIAKAFVALAFILYSMSTRSLVLIGTGRYRDAVVSMILEGPFLPSSSSQYEHPNTPENNNYNPTTPKANTCEADTTSRFTEVLPSRSPLDLLLRVPPRIQLPQYKCLRFSRNAQASSRACHRRPIAFVAQNPLDAVAQYDTLVAHLPAPLPVCHLSERRPELANVTAFTFPPSTCPVRRVVTAKVHDKPVTQKKTTATGSRNIFRIAITILSAIAAAAIGLRVAATRLGRRSRTRPSKSLAAALSLKAHDIFQSAIPEKTEAVKTLGHYVSKIACVSEPASLVMGQAYQCSPGIASAGMPDAVDEVETFTPLTTPATLRAPVTMQTLALLIAINIPLPDSPTIAFESLEGTTAQESKTELPKEAISNPAATLRPLVDFQDLRPNRGRGSVREGPKALGRPVPTNRPLEIAVKEGEALAKDSSDPLHIIGEEEQKWLDTYDNNRFTVAAKTTQTATPWSSVVEATSVTRPAFQIRGDVFANAKGGSAPVNATSLSEIGLPVSWRTLEPHKEAGLREDIEPRLPYQSEREFNVDLGDIDLPATTGKPAARSKSKKKFVLMWGSDNSLALSGARGRKANKILESSGADTKPPASASLSLTTTSLLPEPVPELVSPGDSSFESSLASSFADISIDVPSKATASEYQVDSVIVVDGDLDLPIVDHAWADVKDEAVIHSDLESVVHRLLSSPGDMTVTEGSPSARTETDHSIAASRIPGPAEQTSPHIAVASVASTSSNLALEEDDDDEDEFSRPITLEGYTPGFNFAAALKSLSLSSSLAVVEVPTVEPPRKRTRRGGRRVTARRLNAAARTN